MAQRWKNEAFQREESWGTFARAAPRASLPRCLCFACNIVVQDPARDPMHLAQGVWSTMPISQRNETKISYTDASESVKEPVDSKLGFSRSALNPA